jgi:hypothetical protein
LLDLVHSWAHQSAEHVVAAKCRRSEATTERARIPRGPVLFVVEHDLGITASKEDPRSYCGHVTRRKQALGALQPGRPRHRVVVQQRDDIPAS